MKIKIKRNEIILLWNGLEEFVTTENQPLRFAYALSRTRRYISDIYNDIMKHVAPLSQYVKERTLLCEEMGERDESGDLVLIGNKYSIKNKIEFEKKLKEIKEKTGQNKFEKEILEWLNEKEEIEIYPVCLEDCPEKVDFKKFDAIVSIVTDPEKSSE
jgi:hypothetical protein